MWSHAGMICTGETYKNVVKMTFAKGASLPDPSGLFNSSLEGNTRRAIDFHEGEQAFRGAEFGWAKMPERLPGVAGSLARRKGS